MVFNLAAQIQVYISVMEERGVLTRTFRRLDYPRQLSVLKAVLAEALQSGPASVNIKRVARRAGVSVGSLYQYFGSRKHMLECIFELSVMVTHDFCEKLSPILSAQPLNLALASYVEQVLEIGNAEPALVTLWSKSAYEGDPVISERWVKPISYAIHGLLRSILIAAKDKGELNENISIDSAISMLDALTAAFFDSVFQPHINAFYGMSHAGSNAVDDWKRLSDILMQGIARPANAIQLTN